MVTLEKRNYLLPRTPQSA